MFPWILQIQPKITRQLLQPLKTTTKKKTDPNYDASRDKSHQYATKDHPITVQQSDGEYTYYGPGHYDYYAGGNHMSGEYYKEKQEQLLNKI